MGVWCSLATYRNSIRLCNSTQEGRPSSTIPSKSMIIYFSYATDSDVPTLRILICAEAYRGDRHVNRPSRYVGKLIPLRGHILKARSRAHWRVKTDTDTDVREDVIFEGKAAGFRRHGSCEHIYSRARNVGSRLPRNGHIMYRSVIDRP